MFCIVSKLHRLVMELMERIGTKIGFNNVPNKFYLVLHCFRSRQLCLYHFRVNKTFTNLKKIVIITGWFRIGWNLNKSSISWDIRKLPEQKSVESPMCYWKLTCIVHYGAVLVCTWMRQVMNWLHNLWNCSNQSRGQGMGIDSSHANIALN